ncbi:MAG: tRNA (N(6)-L-threonylcarbamoyladenosine(37)-C(2))-methylthiotransferase [Nanoarchaeota archaeon]|nr:tRNA (N(6)-L-threonylcarbamoyladenosine(37)-C(2))-methylthiotransferase [Nanoarchaeota archaeon]
MKINIETYGCESNVSSSETIAGLIAEAGHQMVPFDSAEVIILNTCALQLSTENKILRRLSELNMQRKRVLVMGCLTEIIKEKIEEVAPTASIAAVSSTAHVVEILEKMQSNTRVLRFKDKPIQLINSPKLKINQYVAIIPISDGCSENCSYCIDAITRGILISNEPDRIIREVQNAVASGAREIHLVAQDVAAYGKDNGSRLPALLRKLTSIPGEFRIKLGSMNPTNVMPILKDLILAYNHPKIYKYLEIPMQSGSNKILAEMKREYTAEQYKNIVAEFRKAYSNTTIATDVIIGFPGESDEDFGKTIALINEIKPDVLKAYNYSVRPLTKAASMPDQIPSWKIKNRSDEVKTLSMKYADMKNEEWLGWKGDVLVTEMDDGTPIGRNFAYKPVLLDNRAKVGDVVTAEITKTRSDYLVAK